MNEIYLAYLAGILDGEGCLTLTKIYRKDNRNKKPQFKEEVWGHVSIGWADIPKQVEYLKELKENFGGYYLWRKSKKQNQKDFVYWRLTNNKSSEFLKVVLPYLRVKKRQAEIIIRFHHLKLENRGKRVDPSPEEMLERKALLQEIRKLNKRSRN